VSSLLAGKRLFNFLALTLSPTGCFAGASFPARLSNTNPPPPLLVMVLDGFDLTLVVRDLNPNCFSCEPSFLHLSMPCIGFCILDLRRFLALDAKPTNFSHRSVPRQTRRLHSP